MSSHEHIISRFKGPAELASVTGMSLGAAKQARRRGSIAWKYWPRLVEAGKATLDELANPVAGAEAQDAA